MSSNGADSSHCHEQEAGPSRSCSPATSSRSLDTAVSAEAGRMAATSREKSKVESNILIVDWDGPDDPKNPRNWTRKKKWAASLIVAAFTFISPVSSSMIAPASPEVAAQFGITNTVLIAMITSVFVLAYAVGPLFLGPLSEVYGRTRVLQYANLFYLVWNFSCAFAKNTEEIILFRFFSGLGGSAPLAVGGAVLADIWSPEERYLAISIYSVAPLLGPVIGPVAGAWIAERTTWQWVFWSTSIADVIVQVAGLIYLKESFPPLLLERKAEQIRKSLVSDTEKGLAVQDVRTIYEHNGKQTLSQLLAHSLTRPFKLWLHEPIIQFISLYMAFVYGTLYLYLTSIPSIFADVYHQTPGIAGLHYIAFGLGSTFAAQVSTRIMTPMYIKMKERNGGVGEPEFRVPPMFVASIVLPAGLLISGWTARSDIPWIVTDIGLALVGMGIILNFLGLQTYVIDCFTLHAASALAGVSCIRSLAGFGFPLFAPSMYKALGLGKGDTILAAVSIGIGMPASFVLWKYGKAIRARSKYAKKSS